MSFSKGQVLLFIYDKLSKEKRIYKSAIQDACGISSITFKRYIGEIRNYYAKIHPELKIVYDRKKDRYLVRKVGE